MLTSNLPLIPTKKLQAHYEEHFIHIGYSSDY